MRSSFISFNMLENGEYPSFADIGHFLSEGYDFALYEQSIINPKTIGYSTEMWKTKFVRLQTSMDGQKRN